MVTLVFKDVPLTCVLSNTVIGEMSSRIWGEREAGLGGGVV